jgi:hypothetical protein
MHTLDLGRRLLRAAAGAALVVLGACGTATANPSTGPAPAPDVFQLYAAALEDAAIYEVRDLVPLNGAQVGADGTVNVVTLKSAAWPVRDTTVNGFVWVTLVPEVRDSCDDWADADKAMRLRQLLGLQPTQPVTYFMEMRVPASALFRPTANDAITTDTLCNPAVDGAGCALQFPANTSPAHYEFMVNQAFSSWKMPDGYPAQGTGDWQQLGYPWTRLGYTYNWHPGSPRYGASEYVIRPGTQVTVTSAQSIAEYCGPG